MVSYWFEKWASCRVSDDIICSTLNSFLIKKMSSSFLEVAKNTMRYFRCKISRSFSSQKIGQIFRDYKIFAGYDLNSGGKLVLGRTRYLDLVNMFSKGKLNCRYAERVLNTLPVFCFTIAVRLCKALSKRKWVTFQFGTTCVNSFLQ